ncbi:unnamed protein product [Darwinula stevensoni]|uniref:Uncharacterized protein n=1 Tax=Darwinula stevensoni TaxID=69355 RepID=A0A7R8XEF5_9CRUS|nr:unnamed protein product [Darwinula stevensoni]CAG0889640.1 unnamed protein product [Darwinula stevensoni]
MRSSLETESATLRPVLGAPVIAADEPVPPVARRVVHSQETSINLGPAQKYRPAIPPNPFEDQSNIKLPEQVMSAQSQLQRYLRDMSGRRLKKDAVPTKNLTFESTSSPRFVLDGPFQHAEDQQVSSPLAKENNDVKSSQQKTSNQAIPQKDESIHENFTEDGGLIDMSDAPNEEVASAVNIDGFYNVTSFVAFKPHGKVLDLSTSFANDPAKRINMES